MKDATIEDFIGIFPGVIPEELCDKYIGFYDQFEKNGMTMTRLERAPNMSPMLKDNSMVYIDQSDGIGTVNRQIKDDIFESFIPLVNLCMEEYLTEYGILRDLGSLAMYRDIKIQKTRPKEGYHAWHCEQGDRNSSTRLLLVIGYLNDVKEGGETEFLYQSLRVRPQKGTVLVLPGSFTHTHRGNPPLTGDKYIINGWVEFIQ